MPVRILLIEDNPDHVLVTKRILERMDQNYRLDCVDKGKDGIRKALEEGYDLVLCDYRLPDLTALDVLKKLKASGREKPFVVITSSGSEKIAVDLMKEGACDYIIKDVSYEDTLPMVVKRCWEGFNIKRAREEAEKSLRESKQKMETLHETAYRLAICETEEKVYQLVVDVTRHILNVSLCALKVAEGNKLVIKAALPQLPPGVDKEGGLEEGLSGETYRSGKSSIFGAGTGISGKAPAAGKGFNSGISAPIGDIGVLEVFSAETDAFTGNDVRLLEMLLGYALEGLKRIRMQKQLEDQAIHDSLTGVYNRHYLEQFLSREIKRSRRSGRPIAFLMIDVNRFKEINDRFGHQTGDKILQLIASLLLENVREIDIVVRYGGDEFLAVLSETNGEANVIKRRILEGLARRNEKNKLLDFPVTLSIGDAYWNPGNSESVEAVLARADKRMYEEKKKKPGNSQPE